MTIHLSSRWTPQHIKRRDTSTGFFEEVNPPRMSADALKLQAALLMRERVVRVLGMNFRVKA